jgi:hypothetical protein
VDGDFSLLEELDESDFSAVSNWDVESLVVHFDSGFAVEEDALLDELDDVVGEFAVEEGVLSAVFDESALTVELGHFHVVLSQSACFAGADLLNAAHDLWGVKVLDQDAVVLHPHD